MCFCIFVFIDICVYIPVNLCIDIFTHYERNWKTPKNWENSRYTQEPKICPATIQYDIWVATCASWLRLSLVLSLAPNIWALISIRFCVYASCRLRTISNFRFSFLSGIVQFHILSSLGFTGGGGWNNPHTIQPFLSWLISQPTPPPQGTSPEIKPD